MPNALESEFKKDPVSFLYKYNLSVFDGTMTTGPQNVTFMANQERLLLKRAEDGGIPVYFLRASPDDDNLAIAFNLTDRDYFFTSTITGCQVLITGDSKYSLSVQHNNDLSGTGRYEKNAANMQGAIQVRVHNGGYYDITRDDIGNIVGVKNQSGWNFYFQKIARDQSTSVKSRSVTKLT